ncbi:MAG TPA: APC family permease [Thermoanaerobaculia bacterium]|nr:APC family permease [Thermoanaerobaculia bacterium]
MAGPTAETAETVEEEPRPRLRRAMGLFDLILFYVATSFSLRWIATAAATGPGALAVWGIACLAFFVPLALAVLELSSRHPDQGGIYVWTKRAFGGFSGFMAGWLYWSSNLPYLPSLLYFGAANALFVGGDSWQRLADDRGYFLLVSLLGLGVAVAVNVVGLDVGKWLHNLGAVGQWLPAAALVGLGVVSFTRFGSATEFTAASLLPDFSFKDVIFWSTMAFAFGGVESASNMSEEIRDARRNVPRALLAGGLLIAAVYVLATAALLVALPQSEVTGLQGILQAITRVGARLGLEGLGPPVAVLVTLGVLGTTGAWFAATARLPFVAGLDRYLPPAFGRLHPRWGTPHVALLVQAAVAAVICVLGQAGTTVKGAYEVLVSMGIISYFIPYLFLFAALIKLQREPAGPEVVRVPGGRPVALLVGGLGFATTTASIVFACIPAADEPHKALAAAKTIGLSLLLAAVGAAVYAAGVRRARS